MGEGGAMERQHLVGHLKKILGTEFWEIFIYTYTFLSLLLKLLSSNIITGHRRADKAKLLTQLWIGYIYILTDD